MDVVVAEEETHGAGGVSTCLSSGIVCLECERSKGEEAPRLHVCTGILAPSRARTTCLEAVFGIGLWLYVKERRSL
jgi:hypothetical protein